MPQVSVVIPTYRHSNLLLTTLESVFAQTFTDFEVIVVNDGSPDDTAEKVRPLIDSGRIRYLEQENAGQAAARNRGIAEAQGMYLALLDDDDLWPPDKLAWQVAAFHAQPDAVLVYGQTILFGDQDRGPWPPRDAPHGDVALDFLKRNWLYSPGQALIRTSALRTVGGLDTAIWGADDWDLYIRLAQAGPFVYRPQVALRYRLHGQNASKDIGKMYANLERVHHKHLGRKPSLKNFPVWWACRQFIRFICYENAVAQAESQTTKQDWRGARQNWKLAIRLWPQALRSRYVCYRVLLALLPPWGAAFCRFAVNRWKRRRSSEGNPAKETP